MLESGSWGHSVLQTPALVLETLVDLQSPMIFEKIQPQGLLGFGEDFKGFHHISAWRHLGQWRATILQSFIYLPQGGSK